MQRRDVLTGILSALPLSLDVFHKVHQIEVERIVEKTIQYQPFIYNTSYSEPEPERLIGLSPTWCAACRGFDKSKLEPIVQWRTEEVKGVRQYPAVYDPITKSYYYGNSLSSLDSLRDGINKTMLKKGMTARHPQAAQFGEIDKEIITNIKKAIGKSGTFSRLGKEAIDFGYGSLILDNFSGSWSTKQNETEFKFTGKPRLRLKVIEQPISGITISDNFIRIGIDWFPDIEVIAKGFSIPQKATQSRWSYPNNTSKDWLASTDMGHHLIHGHGQPQDIVNDLTENERFGLHSDLHRGRFQGYILFNIDMKKWG